MRQLLTHGQFCAPPHNKRAAAATEGVPPTMASQLLLATYLLLPTYLLSQQPRLRMQPPPDSHSAPCRMPAAQRNGAGGSPLPRAAGSRAAPGVSGGDNGDAWQLHGTCRAIPGSSPSHAPNGSATVASPITSRPRSLTRPSADCGGAAGTAPCCMHKVLLQATTAAQSSGPAP
jgi:hypothetical protein